MRVRTSSADARLPRAKMAFMISLSRRVKRSGLCLGIYFCVSNSCDCCHILMRHMSHVNQITGRFTQTEPTNFTLSHRNLFGNAFNAR